MVSSDNSPDRVFQEFDVPREDKRESGIATAKSSSFFSRTYTYSPSDKTNVYEPIKLNRGSVLKFLERSYEGQQGVFIEGNAFTRFFKKLSLSDKEISDHLRTVLSKKFPEASKKTDQIAQFFLNSTKSTESRELPDILLTGDESKSEVKKPLLKQLFRALQGKTPTEDELKHFSAFIDQLKDYTTTYTELSIQKNGDNILIKAKKKEETSCIIGILFSDKWEVGPRTHQNKLFEGTRTLKDGTIQLFKDGKQESPSPPSQQISKENLSHDLSTSQHTEHIFQQNVTPPDTQEKNSTRSTLPSVDSLDDPFTATTSKENTTPTSLNPPISQQETQQKQNSSLSAEVANLIGSTEKEKKEIESFISKLPPEKQKLFCNSLKSILEGITQGDRIKIFSYLKEKVTKPEELCIPAAPLLKSVSNADECLEILKFIRTIPSGQERTDFCKVAEPVLDGITETGGREKLLKFIKKESQENRALLCEPAAKLMVGVTKAADRLKLLEFAKALPTKDNEKSNFCDDAHSVFKNFININIDEILEFLESIKNILPSERKEVCETIQLLLRDEIPQKELLEIFSTVTNLKKGEREEICETAQPFLTDVTNAKERKEVLLFISMLETEEREAIKYKEPALFLKLFDFIKKYVSYTEINSFHRTVIPLLKNIDSLSDQSELLNFWLEIPKKDRSWVFTIAKDTQPVINFVRSFKSCISPPKNQVFLKELILKSFRNIIESASKDEKMDIIEFIANQEVEERMQFCNLAAKANPGKRLKLLKSIKYLLEQTPVEQTPVEQIPKIKLEHIQVRTYTSSALNKEIELGVFSRNLLRGIRLYRNGMTEEGTFYDDELDGSKCVRIDENGKAQRGVFIGGIFQEAENKKNIENFIEKLKNLKLIQPDEGKDIDTIDKAKKFYKELSLKYHPDKGGDQEKFKSLQAAHELIKDL